MTTVFVSRNEASKITGVYANRQPGEADEEIYSTDPAVLSFLDPTVRPNTLPEVKEYLINALPALREACQQRGMKYTFPDGSIGTVQTRNERDTGIINGQVTAALVLSSQGITSAVMSFRVEENILYTLTPEQMTTMGMAASAFVSSTYFAKWSKEAEITALNTLTKAKAYDLNAGWPA